MSDTVAIAHLSDVHLPPLGRLPVAHLNLKRALGWLNWHRKRRHIHTRPALDALMADLVRQAPDHIVVSGDLINIGLPGEYEAANRWLATVGKPERVSVVPGNHDIYVRLATDPGVARWASYMQSDVFGADLIASLGFASDRPLTFPYVRRIGPVALIGLNSAEHTPVGYASGRLGGTQIKRLADLLDRLGHMGLARMIVIHHPPLVSLARPHRGLVDAAELEMVLSRHGAELVVYGHNHRLAHDAAGLTRIEGIASASAARVNGREPAACYNVFRFTRWASGFTEIACATRGIVDGSLAVAPVKSAEQLREAAHVA